jgi:hypothetical protein
MGGYGWMGEVYAQNGCCQVKSFRVEGGMPCQTALSSAGRMCKQNTNGMNFCVQCQVRLNPIMCVENQITIAKEIILKEIDQVLRFKELELSQVEIEVQSLRIVAELLSEEADQEEARKLAGAT